MMIWFDAISWHILIMYCTHYSSFLLDSFHLSPFPPFFCLFYKYQTDQLQGKSNSLHHLNLNLIMRNVNKNKNQVICIVGTRVYDSLDSNTTTTHLTNCKWFHSSLHSTIFHRKLIFPTFPPSISFYFFCFAFALYEILIQYACDYFTCKKHSYYKPSRFETLSSKAFVLGMISFKISLETKSFIIFNMIKHNTTSESWFSIMIFLFYYGIHRQKSHISKKWLNTIQSNGPNHLK